MSKFWCCSQTKHNQHSESSSQSLMVISNFFLSIFNIIIYENSNTIPTSFYQHNLLKIVKNSLYHFYHLYHLNLTGIIICVIIYFFLHKMYFLEHWASWIQVCMIISKDLKRIFKSHTFGNTFGIENLSFPSLFQTFKWMLYSDYLQKFVEKIIRVDI